MLSNEVYLLLVKLTKELTDNNIKYWLDGGTLLGIYRDKELINYDTDMDLGLYEDSFEGDNRRKIIEIMNNLNWFETDTYSYKMKFRYSNSDITIDFFKFIRADKYWCHWCFNGYMYYKLECINSLKEFNCNENIFIIPNHIEKYLEDIYGNTWRYSNPNFKKPKDYCNWVHHSNEIDICLKRKIIVFDVDGTLTEPRQIMTKNMKDYLIRLSHSYIVLILGAGSCKRIYSQLDKLDNIIIYGNYGLECAIGSMGILRNIYKEKMKLKISKEMISAFNNIRENYSLTKYTGESYEIHSTGIITFALLGTKANILDKLVFDIDKKKREEIWPKLKELLPEYNILIGGTSSFDILDNDIDKSYGISKILKKYEKHTKKEIYFIGDDWNKYGNDIAVLKTGVTCVKTNSTLETINLIEFLIAYRSSINTRVIPGEI